MEDITELTLDEMCRACAAQTDTIIELISEGVIDAPVPWPDQPPEQWRFTGLHLRQAKIAVRLQRDLGVNLAGAALALQLMDEIQVLREKIRESTA